MKNRFFLCNRHWPSAGRLVTPALLVLCGFAPDLKAQVLAVPEVVAAEAAPVIDVAQLQSMVLQHNATLQAAQLALQASRAAVGSAAAWPNPRLDWSRGPWHSSDAMAAVGQRGQAWSLTQALENPTLRSARIQAADSGKRSAEQQLASVRNDLLAQLHRLVQQVLLHQAEAQAAADSLALLEQVGQRVRVRVDSGEAARYELIKADAEVIHARERKQSAALKAEQSLQEINRLTAGQLPRRWRLVSGADGQEVAVPDLPNLQMLAQEANPELQALRHEFERAGHRLQQVRASVLPAVDLRYAEMKDPQVRQSQWGVSVQLPLLDQRKAAVAEAQAEYERSRVLYEGKRLELEQQVLLAWRGLEIARLRVESLGQGVLKEAESVLRVAEAAYRFGEKGILDVLDAQRVLRIARAELLEARYQMQLARIALDQLSGRYARVSTPL